MITRRWLMDEWRDTFLMQARLHDVPGPRIGEALAEIETHCADSGQSPDAAFGDPVRYAEALARDAAPAGTVSVTRTVRTSVLPTFATLGGIMCLLSGVDAVAHDAPGALTVGQLVAVAAGVVGITFIAVVILRPGRRDVGWRLGSAVAVGFALMMVPQLLWKREVITAPGWPLLAAGLFLLAVAWWPSASGRLVADRVIDPRTGEEPFGRPRLLLAAIRWSLPVLLLCAVVLTVVLPGSRH